MMAAATALLMQLLGDREAQQRRARLVLGRVTPRAIAIHNVHNINTNCDWLHGFMA